MLTIQPDYAGVEVTIPEGGSPQNREAAGWGAWPQGFVDFQLQTGLSSYWYSSGGSADPKKPPLPLTVDFGGAEVPDPGTPDPGTPGGETPKSEDLGPNEGGSNGGGEDSKAGGPTRPRPRLLSVPW